MLKVKLPTQDGTLNDFTLSPPKNFTINRPQFNRKAYSAAHVVANPITMADPFMKATIDWDTTIAYRRYLWSLGLGVAEAMDTAQRGMGLDWSAALELINYSAEAAKDFPGALLISGAGTDQLSQDNNINLVSVIQAYEQQCEAIEKAGSRIALMASRALAKCATSSDDYKKVYSKILSQVKTPVILHWLGTKFDPDLKGYWGCQNEDAAMNACLDIIQCNAAKVEGIKISLLDKQKEIEMRNRLPKGVAMYTGDDFNYSELIEGDKQGYSHALLGIFDAIAPAAAAALNKLGENDIESFRNILEPTIPLSRHIFSTPTQYYKTGIVFIAWLNGHQNHFIMIGGMQSARNILHLSEIFRLADKAGLLRDPELAVQRMKQLLTIHGISA